MPEASAGLPENTFLMVMTPVVSSTSMSIPTQPVSFIFMVILSRHSWVV